MATVTDRIRELIERTDLWRETAYRCLEEDDRDKLASLAEFHGCVRRLYNEVLKEESRRQLRDDVPNL